MDAALLERRAHATIAFSLSSFRAVVLQGARQVGKSTLAQLLASEMEAPIASLDDADLLDQAIDDARLFLDTIGSPAVIDEVQRGGDRLVLALKQRLDRSNARGQYLLTGSSNFLTTPALSESLAGRIDLVTLWPLSVGERKGGADDFVDRAFADPHELVAHQGETPERGDYLELICAGGYPEPQHLAGPARRRWFEQYLDTVLLREVETATELRRLDSMRQLARLMLATTSTELVISRLAADVGIDRGTIQIYEPWLETTFLVHRLPAWSRNVAAKIVRRPKMHAGDTGLAAAILGKDATALARLNDPSVGPLMETFVVNELAKQLTWSTASARMFHLRDRGGLEVDAIIEASDGRVVAVEVKASTTARRDDVASMANLRDRLDRVGDRFVVGVVFHTGTIRRALGDRLVALPIADLWT